MKPNQYSWPHSRRFFGAADVDSSKSQRSTSSPRRVLLRNHPPYSKTRTMSSQWSSSGVLWLSLYFVLSLALTLYNKIVLNHFPFPYTLTALHALCGTIGTFILLHWNSSALFLRDHLRQRKIKRSDPSDMRPGALTNARNDTPDAIIPPIPTLRGKQLLVLFLYSVLYSVNILVSNMSLRLVTVPFHQVVRASAPLFTVALSALLLGQYCSRAKLVTLIPVIAGVGFATYGDYYFTPRGFFLTLLGTLLAALKTITTNLLQKPAPTPQPVLYPPLSPQTPPFKFPLLLPGDGHGELAPEKHGAAFGCPRLIVTDFSSNDQDLGKSEIQQNVFQTQPLLSDFEPTPHPESAPSQPNSPIRKILNSILPSSRSHTRLHSLSPILLRPNRQSSPWNRLCATLELPRLSLTSLQLLYLLSPIAFVQTTMLAHFTGELDRVNLHLNKAAAEYARRSLDVHASDGVIGKGVTNWMGMSSSPRLWLVMNGVLAFFLNVVSFNANRKVGALAMSVAANVKQVLAILCSVTLFNLTVSPMNGLGIFLTLIGGAWYAAVELEEKKRRN